MTSVSCSSKKVLFLSYVPRLHDPLQSSTTRQSRRASRTAVVVERNSADQISIQGYAPVAYGDKHRCWNLFQVAVKQLLAVPSSISVCIRFAEPPHSPISSLHTVLQEPSHVVDLIVSPLPASLCSSASPTTSCETTHVLHAKDERDPYCRYRDMYKNRQRTVSGRHSNASKDSSSFVRQKCDFAEMNRLLSQLAEVSLTLQRTREECDMIAKRCPPKACQRSQNSLSCVEDEVDGLLAPATWKGSATLEDSDMKVNKLIHLAQTITQGVLKEKEQEKATVSPISVQGTHLSLPDCPTDIHIQSSFSEGGAFVMWNPISLGIDDTNRGNKICGYLVFVDEHLWAESPGPLSSQVELDGLKHNTEYHIQVCTQAEHCNSLLSLPFTYCHLEPKKSLSGNTSHLSSRKDDSQAKAERVESWLKSSQEVHVISGDTDSNVSHNHVQFAKEACSGEQVSSVASPSRPKQYLLHTDCERDSPGAEDTKSITSSHTSGIVTDLPNSPKLSPACVCAACTHSESIDGGHMIIRRCSHRKPTHQRSLLDSPAREGQPRKKKSSCSSTSVTSSTLCPSPIPSTGSYIPDTVIDEAIDFSMSKPDLVTETPFDVSSVRQPTPLRGPFAHYGLATPHKGPSSPENVRVMKGRDGSVSVSWTPVRRDLKGCSSGFYVLGYRIYVNGSFSQTVDGAVKFETTLKCPLSSMQPPYHRLLIHVRTRSMAAESLPSNTVVFDLVSQRMVEPAGRTKPLDSVISSVDTVSLCTKTSASLLSHPASKACSYPPTNNRRHIETFV